MDTQPIIINNTMHPIVLTHRERSKQAGPDGAPEFVVHTVSLKPGSNALTIEQYAIVEHLREKNPQVRERFERTITRVGSIITENIGRPELEDGTKLDQRAIAQAVRQCSDPDSLRKLRSAFGQNKALADLIENQLAACTVTTGGEAVAHDVRRDPKDPRKAA